ncbi:MAG TPA: RecQ family ATP-dependent DNA helicase [Euzebyales bacterium]|nr:RecQ family ATP-dependent DNA helicase [Euzebyales bacterium]
MRLSTSLPATAADLLADIAGPDAAFRPGQSEAIAALVDERRRVLLVQRTGWGKSAVYFSASRLLRDRGSGPTLLISPLLALMRNQIEMAQRAGVRAVTINSANVDQWQQVDQQLHDDDVDLLLVSPERLNNPRFREQLQQVVAPRTGLLVIDEAHCISDWGHDFRPDYRRVRTVLELLPPGVPVLCSTATANDRVVADITAQLGDDLLVLRGTLERDSLALQAITLPDPAARLAWLAEHVPSLPGSGIVYCLTIGDVDRVATWLRDHGVDAEAYSGETDPADREAIERRLSDNAVKAVVATSALGMGYDKPDLGFVIHYQSPGSPIAYYQQVGRAGRGIDRAYGVLLCGHEDVDIQDYFITTAFPPREQAERVVQELTNAQEPVSLDELQAAVNIGYGRLTAMLKVLAVEGAVEQAGSAARWRRADRPWSYDEQRVEQVTAIRRREQHAMREYAATGSCLMAFLRHQLDDPDVADCGRCANCAGTLFPDGFDPQLANAASRHLRGERLELTPRKQWPRGLADHRGRIADDDRLEPGRVLCRWGRAGWGPLVEQGKLRERRFDDRLVRAAAELVAKQWAPEPAPEWVTWVPSHRYPMLVADFAHRLASALGLAARETVTVVGQPPSQRTRNNSVQQAANALDAFAGPAAAPTGPVLLVDDLVHSQWTLTVVGMLLRRAGVGAVHPFVLATSQIG